MSILLTILVAAAAAYVGICLLLYVRQAKLVYVPSQTVAQTPADAGSRAEVLAGDVVTGWGTLSNVGGHAGTYGIEFGMTGTPSPTSEVVVTDAATGNEVARMSLGHLPIPTCG